MTLFSDLFVSKIIIASNLDLRQSERIFNKEHHLNTRESKRACQF